MTRAAIGVADTSLFIALETARDLDTARLPAGLVTTVITQAEVASGVLAATDVETRARRLETLDKVQRMRVLPASRESAHEWARLRLYLRDRARRMEVNDLWIAAIAATNDLPIVTQDADFDVLDGAPGVAIIRV